MSFLLDTCVLSLGIKDAVDETAVRWLRSIPGEEQYASVISLAEIVIGIELLPEGRRKRQLADWFAATLRPSLADRALPFDENCAMIWARLRASDPNARFADSQIAATALVHGFTLVTRNVKDFAFEGLAVFNPWKQ